MFKKYYIAYGSNLNHEIMMENCPSAKIVGTTFLENYRLAFKGSYDDYAYLTVEPSKFSLVPVCLYKISPLDISRLDMFENYPHLYSKKIVNVKVNRRRFKAFLYAMNEKYDYHMPSDFYLNACKEGYREFDFSEKFLTDALKDAKIKRKTL